jgi:catalase
VQARDDDHDLAPSDALSILMNGPESFRGRKVGVLVSDEFDGDLLDALRSALEEEGATLQIVAPSVGGVQASDGTWIEADEKVEGGPSVLYDAVALLLSESGAKELARLAAARDFLADAIAHQKFIAWAPGARPLLDRLGDGDPLDDGFVELDGPSSCAAFVERCRALRYWERESGDV